MEHFDFSLVDWSRLQFAMTAMYHWVFVSLTLGLALIVAIMETIYVRTNNEEWKRLTKFWMILFGVNLALGVATGIILEFQFGTNWSNYSWFVGDVFGAPLAIEGFMAFFLKAAFIAVMFFGWNRVSKQFHLLSTWLVAGSVCLSALWILIANAWMQHPVGMQFNPDLARNEMINFWAVIFSPVAITKFFHSVAAGFVTGGVVVVGISSWFLLKNRHKESARKSILVGAIVGVAGLVITMVSGHFSGQHVARTQPMKLAVIEGLYEGEKGAPFSVVAFGKSTNNPDRPYEQDVTALKIPKLLSFMATHNFNAFVPGIVDLIEGNEEQGIMSAYERAVRGRVAQDALKGLKNAKGADPEEYARLRALFEDEVWLNEYFVHFGYGYFYDDDPAVFTQNIARLVPNVPLNYWSFRIMIGLGFLFLAVLALVGWWAYKDKLDGNGKKHLYRLALLCIPLVYVSTWAGWAVAEVGRQPWAVQDLMPTFAGTTSEMSVGAVQTTFFVFVVIFTVLLIAALKIMFAQIKKGPKEG
ncbi:MAG: cytochrome ubiquinol oxidase subunit I [Bacteroidales bacterium]|jgi:cytochrome d ubiquinol oxidase subunit I|nr:cytochrome ubiquinol oxidase subunit I [Bacteroidales bacterium]